MDHVWRDKRTNKYKYIKRSLIVTLLLLAACNIYTSYRGELDNNQLQGKINYLNNQVEQSRSENQEYKR